MVFTRSSTFHSHSMRSRSRRAGAAGCRHGEPLEYLVRLLDRLRAWVDVQVELFPLAVEFFVGQTLFQNLLHPPPRRSVAGSLLDLLGNGLGHADRDPPDLITSAA